MSLILQAGKLRCQAVNPQGCPLSWRVLPQLLGILNQLCTWVPLGTPGQEIPGGKATKKLPEGWEAMPTWAGWRFLTPGYFCTHPNSSQASAGGLGALKSNSQPPVSLGLLVGLCGLHRKIAFWPTWDCALLGKRREPPRRGTWKTAGAGAHSRTRGQAGLTGTRLRPFGRSGLWLP